eukprot:5638845-Prymnesium_polylepis.1
MCGVPVSVRRPCYPKRQSAVVACVGNLDLSAVVACVGNWYVYVLRMCTHTNKCTPDNHSAMKGNHRVFVPDYGAPVLTNGRDK